MRPWSLVIWSHDINSRSPDPKQERSSGWCRIHQPQSSAIWWVVQILVRFSTMALQKRDRLAQTGSARPAAEIVCLMLLGMRKNKHSNLACLLFWFCIFKLLPQYLVPSIVMYVRSTSVQYLSIPLLRPGLRIPHHPAPQALQVQPKINRPARADATTMICIQRQLHTPR